MPRQIIRVGTAIILASTLALPLALTGVARSAPVTAPQGQILFQRSFQRLGHAHRFAYRQTQTVFHRFKKLVPSTTGYSVAYLTPNRVATMFRTTQAVHGVSQFQTVQIGRTKCERWTKWLCFASPSPRPVALIQPLISPRMNRVTFRVVRAQRNEATEVLMTWQGHGVSYAATMLLQARSGLPLSFRSIVRQHGELDIQLKSSFDYAYPQAIRLPHARSMP